MMRFGWLAAAAAFVCAVPADATTWLRYEVTGKGTETDISSFPVLTTTTRDGDFRLNFSVEVDPAPLTVEPTAGIYSSNGNVFSTLNVDLGVPGGFTVDGTQSGRLLLTTGTQGLGEVSIMINAALNYADVDMLGGLPTSTAGTSAQGSITYKLSSKSVFRSLSGTITGFSIKGLASGYEGPSLITVPEPTSWAMMILGAGMIGAIARRRKVAAAYAG